MVRSELFSQIVTTVSLAALYYPFSIGLTFYQKWFIKNFRFPLTVVCCHYMVKFLSAALYKVIWEGWKREKRVALDWKESVLRIAPTGISAAFDIGLSNWAFEYITVSLYTMSKSTGIIFILVFAVILGLEKLNWGLPLVVLLLSVGLFLFTYHSTQFDWTGFLLVELAAFCSGIRWSFSQLLMQRSKNGLHHPIDMVYHVQPWMTLGILPLAFAFEGEALAASSKGFNFQDFHNPIKYLLLTIVGGLIALIMELTEFLLLVHTSSLTVSITGIIKEIITLALAYHYNNNQFSLVNLLGLLLCLSGICAHVYLKTKTSEQDKSTTVNRTKRLSPDEQLLLAEQSDAE